MPRSKTPKSRRRSSSAKSRRRSRSRQPANDYYENPNIKGKGAYTYSNPGPWGQTGRSIGAQIANTIGSNFGIPRGVSGYIGSRLGGLAHYVGRIFGSGDYRIGTAPAVNSLFQGSARLAGGGSSPSFGEKSVRFKHKEYLQDIISSPTAGAFYNQTFDINPGNAASFPFLSYIANNFQTYKFHGLVYEFKSTSSNSLTSTNTSLGTVVACVDYNAASGAFVGKQDMLNSMGAIDVKPSDNFLMGVECDPRKLPVNELYIRGGPVPDGQDIKTYDMGQLNIASTGMQGASVNLGELHVIYDVELMMPILRDPGQDAQTAVIEYVTATIATATTLLPDYSYSKPLLNTGVFTVVDNIGLEIGSTATGTAIAFPPSSAGSIYQITVQWTGASTALVSGPGLGLGGGLIVLSDLESPAAATTTTRLMCQYTVKVPSANDGIANWKHGFFTSAAHLGSEWPRLRLTVNTGVLPSSLTSCSVSVIRLNPALASTNLVTTYANLW